MTEKMFIALLEHEDFEKTVEFFKEHNYFGYNSEYVRFFIQDMAPSVDFNGKIYMEGEHLIECPLDRLIYFKKI